MKFVCVVGCVGEIPIVWGSVVVAVAVGMAPAVNGALPGALESGAPVEGAPDVGDPDGGGINEGAPDVGRMAVGRPFAL